MPPQAMPKSNRPTDGQRLTELLEEKRQLRLRLAEVESEVESLLVRRAATPEARPRPTEHRLAYRTAEIAKLMGISEMTVVRAIERGDLRAVRLDPAAATGVRLVRHEDLEQWLESMR